MDNIPFPENFWWGTSLSAHQAEGCNHNSWTQWEDQPGHIKNREKSGVAADHLNRYEEDFQRLVWLHANTHRFSIEWSRLQPDRGVWNKEASAHYREMLTSLKAHGIRPIICLFHFTLPLWVADNGGFENPRTVDDFVAFVLKVEEEFGDLVNNWLTLNEPVVYALGGYAAGLTPPGVKDLSRALRVSINLLRAHGYAYHALKNRNANHLISFAQHLRILQPKNKISPLDLWGANAGTNLLNWSWYKAIETGRIRIDIPTIFKADEECPECLGAMDFLGFNYYGRDLISVNPFSKQKFFMSTEPKCEKTDMGWDIYPAGLKLLLQELKKRGLGKYPLLITENGIADKEDSKRPRFIYEHLKTFLEESRQLGLIPMGYLYWSLIDNFEWIDGFGPRFGLFEVDYATQKRKPRRSAYYFSELGAKKAAFPPK